ncbi:MAG: hypothetical protein LPK49_09880 [Bacteroidota bacterium]|nr:hypothetical protein [Bacteroidota bacterium]MDX5431338.1 hypothetical protein [Bacteroidota bacterium]
MQFDGALIKEQGVTFAIAVVKQHVLNSPSDLEDARSGFSIVFPGVPVILMALDSRGTPTYHGRKDIVNFLAKVSPSRIPWKRYTTN